MFIILNARWMIKDESEWMDIHIMLNTCCHSIMLRHFSVLMIKVTWLTLKIYLLGWTCKLVWFECWLDPLIEWLQQCQNCLALCHHKSIGTFCLFEYRALFCVIWSFFGRKWPKSDVMIHRTLHLLDI